MGLDEAFFGKFYKLWKNKFNPDPIDPPYTIYLKPIQHRLEILASALAGHKVDIFPTREPGGFIGDDLYLPEKIFFSSDPQINLKAYLCHVIFSCETKNETQITSQLSSENISRLLKKITLKYPAFQTLAENFLNPFSPQAFGNFSQNKPVAENLSDDEPQTHTPAKGPEIKGKTAPKAELKKTETQDENPLVHTFEKVHTLEEYHGGSKRTDGANEMEEHEEALQELELKYVVRSPEQTDSVFKSDAIVETQETILKDPLHLPAGKIYYYDEWNEKNNEYRKNWVTLHEYDLPFLTQASKTQSPEINKLKQKWELLVNEMQWQKRCLDGSEIDLNAYLNSTDPNRIYEKKVKLNRDLAICVLVDLSLSTDSYVKGQRVFDLVTQSLEVLAHSMEDLIEQVALGGFYSETRQKVSFLNLKDFQEPFSVYAKRRGWLKPTGYTRLGAPLRHMHEKLKKVKARKKWLFLISDAKPTDYDYYEGRYGMADLRRALLELGGSDIHTHVFAVTEDKSPRYAQMFGQNGFSYLHNQNDFMAEMSKQFLKLIR
jgi:nitric oxide reductase NorD protein